MDVSEVVKKDALVWLIAAGLFAIALSLFLFWSDRLVSAARWEEQNYENLRSLREAQLVVSSGIVDPRQVGQTSGARLTDQNSANQSSH